MINNNLLLIMETTIHLVDKKEEKPKAKKPKCFHCKKKLKMTELNFKCKCNHVFCHQHPKSAFT